MKGYGKAMASCKRIACNPCGPDEYEVTIKPHGEPEQAVYTFAGLFEGGESICGRIYRQWLKERI